MDRALIREMVEDYWRAILPAFQTGGTAAFADVSNRFEERIASTAQQLPPVEAAAFLQMVEAEREQMSSAFDADPESIRRRLGLSPGPTAVAPQPYRAPGAGLGELAVRTAVRATVWDAIGALFRLGR